MATIVLKVKPSVLVEVEAPSGAILSTVITSFAKSAKATRPTGTTIIWKGRRSR